MDERSENKVSKERHDGQEIRKQGKQGMTQRTGRQSGRSEEDQAWKQGSEHEHGEQERTEVGVCTGEDRKVHK
jgi:hypothetical protein